MALFVVRTTAGREDLVAELISEEAKKGKFAIYSISLIPGLKGYLLVEADNHLEIQRVIHEIPHAKSVLQQEVPINDILKYLEEEKIIELNRGDIVEILIGAFKGTRARVIKFDSKKEEVMVELLDTPVPLNVSIPATGVKLIKREEEK